MAVTAIHLFIHGRVQGVGYRAWTVSVARELGLTGWVRNRNEGSVEALIAGDPTSLETMLTRCHEGPIGARVDRIHQSNWDGEIPEDFRSLPTV